MQLFVFKFGFFENTSNVAVKEPFSVRLSVSKGLSLSPEWVCASAEGSFSISAAETRLSAAVGDCAESQPSPVLCHLYKIHFV